MQRAMAKQAEAERDKRAKVISAQGELDAAKILADAAQALNQQQNAIVLRYLDTMKEVSAGSGKSTIIFPMPMDFISSMVQGLGGNNKNS